jgi:hypothetical protein
MTHIESTATKAEREASRIAAAESALHEPHTPTEEELQELEVDVMLGRAEVEKARARFTAKARNHESQRILLAKSRQRFEAAATARREQNKRRLMEERSRKLALRRQLSEEQ